MYPKRIAALPICRFEEEYLLLRLDRKWKFCPGDWDFVIATFVSKEDSPAANAILNVKLHTALEGKIEREYPVLEWCDHESKILFVLYPFVIKVSEKALSLSHKFCETKWLRLEKILEYDRNQYLATVLSHLQNHSASFSKALMQL